MSEPAGGLRGALSSPASGRRWPALLARASLTLVVLGALVWFLSVVGIAQVEHRRHARERVSLPAA